MAQTLVTHLSSPYMEVQQRAMRAVANIAVNGMHDDDSGHCVIFRHTL